MIRITGGERRGLHLKTPKGDHLRPTQDRLRKTVFDILHERVHGVKFLDLFAGTGAMGIEALSRGAKEATFVEKDPQTALLIKENLKLAKYSGRVMTSDARKAVKHLESSFDVIYIDPPYGDNKPPANPMILEILKKIESEKLLTPHGEIFVESSVYEKWETPLGLSHLILTKERTYGRVRLTQFSFPSHNA
ncbi:MAG: 16S rRNA (guanine(966)-N(2))-methyltransferase RsmD [Simkaniaceae bacterium]|nr:16S rRNA (guanine(966)-N(2))-methyltransferase RsmD [Simkaniaceae bacterium]